MKVGRAVGMFALGTALIVLGAGNAPAQGAKKSHDHRLMYELRKTAYLLSKADRDYQGHRAIAVQQINAAIGDLKKEANLQGFKGDGDAFKGKEAQWKSDKQLRRAIAELRSTHKQIKELPKTKLRTQASEHVAKAIKELEIALKIK